MAGIDELPTPAHHRQHEASCAQQRVAYNDVVWGRAYSELRLPLWEQPISSAAVTALVEHPALEKCVMSGSGSLLMTDALCALGIFSVCRARRYQPAGMQYVHVLRTVT